MPAVMSRTTPFRRILVANRGEIALRIIRSARAMGYATVAMYSDADAQARHVLEADQALRIGPASPAQSYLDSERVLAAARASGADAVHPGYGFLAENAAFAEACVAAGLVFIGPAPAMIAAMGNKAGAKRLMSAAGLPCLPGYEGDDQDDARLLQAAREIGFPVMIKAVAGGGGRGIRRVDDAAGFAAALRSARSEAASAFGDATMILEKAILAPRHIEIQVMADRHGKVLHLGERDCSVQRRNQKLIEETPAPSISAELRERMCLASTAAMRVIGYEGAGTIEYLVDEAGNFFFMEMNTRLQVEHTVTEEVTGLDLVEMQLRVAAGEALALDQQDIRFRGHAIQVRLCCEDAQQGFMPQSGVMQLWRMPAGLRCEHALRSGERVTPDYDSMLAKLIAFGPDREEARRRLAQALANTAALGVTTNQDFLRACLDHPVFVSGRASTAFIDEAGAALWQLEDSTELRGRALAAVLLHLGRIEPRHAGAGLLPVFDIIVRLRMHGRSSEVVLQARAEGRYNVLIDDSRIEIRVLHAHWPELRLAVDGIDATVLATLTGDTLHFRFDGRTLAAEDLNYAAVMHGATLSDGCIRASMTGSIVAVHAALGDELQAGQAVFTLEAMKMEHVHTAPLGGRLVALDAQPGQQVSAHGVIARIEAP